MAGTLLIAAALGAVLAAAALTALFYVTQRRAPAEPDAVAMPATQTGDVDAKAGADPAAKS